MSDIPRHNLITIFAPLCESDSEKANAKVEKVSRLLATCSDHLPPAAPSVSVKSLHSIPDASYSPSIVLSFFPPFLPCESNQAKENCLTGICQQAFFFPPLLPKKDCTPPPSVPWLILWSVMVGLTTCQVQANLMKTNFKECGVLFPR